MGPAQVRGQEPWRDLLTARLTQSRRVMRRRLWAPALIATRSLPGPNALTRSERFHAALADADLPGPEPVTAVGTLSSHVNGGFVAAANGQCRCGATAHR
ncbi:TetR/AcrR family transcriptional regulator C-terminal domain-containing protein [Actinomadura sp. ATCC 39365]